MSITISANGEMKMGPPIVDPACPRCADTLRKLVCPTGMSIASWCFHRLGDFCCDRCLQLQQAGKLHPKAKVCWFEYYFQKRAA
jgi:hypothetical protein